MKKRFFILLLGLIGLVMCCTACGGDDRSEPTSETTTEETSEEVKSTVIYIGQKRDYGKYNMLYTGELTPAKVLNGIEETTGWDLSLDKEITKRDDGYILCFSEDSIFYTGETLDEDDEFYLSSQEDFYVTVLDSITRSFQRHFKIDDKNPNMYYWGADDSNLILTGTGKTLPKDVAYQHESLENFTTRRYIGGETAVSYDLDVTFVRMQDEETVVLTVEGSTQMYSVTYTALKAIFKNAQEGRQMRIQITEDTATGEKLITKIY